MDGGASLHSSSSLPCEEHVEQSATKEVTCTIEDVSTTEITQFNFSLVTEEALGNISISFHIESDITNISSPSTTQTLVLCTTLCQMILAAKLQPHMMTATAAQIVRVTKITKMKRVMKKTAQDSIIDGVGTLFIVMLLELLFRLGLKYLLKEQLKGYKKIYYIKKKEQHVRELFNLVVLILSLNIHLFLNGMQQPKNSIISSSSFSSSSSSSSSSSLREALLAEQTAAISASYPACYSNYELLRQLLIVEQKTKRGHRKHFYGINWKQLKKRIPEIRQLIKEEKDKKRRRQDASQLDITTRLGLGAGTQNLQHSTPHGPFYKTLSL
ncbi:hypothetical protein QOT17_001100 [Balamuthia mandrillaris]